MHLAPMLSLLNQESCLQAKEIEAKLVGMIFCVFLFHCTEIYSKEPLHVFY